MSLPTMHVMTASGFDERRDRLVEDLRQGRGYSGKVCVHDDVERRGVLWNHLQIIRCMSYTVEPHNRWALVMQDDAIGLPGWEDHLEQVMFSTPAPYVSLGHFAKYGRDVVAKGAPYGFGTNVIWGQAVLYDRSEVRRAYLPLVEDFYAMDAEKYRKWDDGLIAVLNLLEDTKAVFTARALVEHQDWESTMGHVKGRWRHAESTIADPGPGYFVQPRSRAGGPAVHPVQREALADLLQYRKDRS